MKQLLKVLSPNGPLFPPGIAGIQGTARRHLYLTAAVSLFQGLTRPLRVLEVGSWVGCSALTWAQAIAHFLPDHRGSVLCVDPWAPYLSSAQANRPGVYPVMDFALQHDIPYGLFLYNISFAPPGVSVDHFRGPSRQVLPYLAPLSFDIVYVDGD